MEKSYQERDYNIVDYKSYQLDGFNNYFRGPKPTDLIDNKFFTCIGAAQTFGCFTENPFPELLSKKLNIEVLNAGVSGAGPLFFLSHKKYLHLANKSKFVIIQVMSGRSESNHYFDSILGRGYLIRKSDGKKMPAEKAYNELISTVSQEDIIKIVEETKQNYLLHMIKLLKLIKVPKILLWFSVRDHDYEPTFENARSLFGKFPQFVDQELLDKMIFNSDYFVDCISSAGLPQVLINRFTGEKTNYTNKIIDDSIKQFNYYYPSPEMHQLAFDSLYPVCKEILSHK